MIIEKLKESGLKGRSGSCFPTWVKWEAVLKAKKKVGKCFVVCNAAEGEPAVFKDKYLLETYPEEIINGIKIAIETLDAEKAFIYLRNSYFKKFKKTLEKIIGNDPIELFAETGGYLCGEETTLMESVVGNRNEPRIRPPFPTEAGLFGFPTLINNVETFYSVSKIEKGQYSRTRFYCISGKVKNPGVFEFPEDMPIGEILEQTNNAPLFKYFVQVGGGASGGIMILEELFNPVEGAASIVVYDQVETNPRDLMRKWINFYYNQNCGKCVPCREGVYRLKEMLDSEESLNLPLVRAVLNVLGQFSFCHLGKGVAFSMKSLLERVELKK
ncbi:SLBB domain-containing protein [Patescibacteria group bacterium]|nr:SLBB domain-containing protein [Patescibacteria group bacterium]